MKTTIKKILGFILVTAIVVAYGFRGLISYGWGQFLGQAEILVDARDVDEVLTDKSVEDDTKRRIRFIQDVKKFAEDSLGIKGSANYSTYYEHGKRPILWIVTASAQFSLEDHTWKFPVVGEVSYRGYFDLEKARGEVRRLKEAGLDVGIREVTAWSTLGWFKDPILSGFIDREEGDLANLIIHELTHGTIYLSGEVAWNENLANYVGDVGTIKFLNARYGKGSGQLKLYDKLGEWRNVYISHMLRGADSLQLLYEGFDSGVSHAEKKELKERLILQIVKTVDTLDSQGIVGKIKRWEADSLPNNSYFMGLKRYNDQRQFFEDLHVRKFEGDFKSFFDYLQNHYKD